MGEDNRDDVLLSYSFKSKQTSVQCKVGTSYAPRHKLGQNLELMRVVQIIGQGCCFHKLLFPYNKLTLGGV